MTQSKAEIIEERKANLPLPEQPPVASDWNSADETTVNVGSGRLESDITYGKGSETMREPATAESAVRTSGEEWKTETAGDDVGRQGRDNLGGIPNDAVTKEARNKQGTVETRQKDYGYPEKNDPSSGL